MLKSEKYLKSSGSKSNLTDEEKAMFKADSERRKLDSASSDRG